MGPIFRQIGPCFLRDRAFLTKPSSLGIPSFVRVNQGKDIEAGTPIHRPIHFLPRVDRGGVC